MSKISLKHSGGNVVSLNSPTNAPSAADVAFKLPNADGSDGQAIVTDGSGNLSFGSVAATRNLIINGAMQVAQRGSASSSTQGLATVDRFKKIGSGCGNTFSQEQITLTSGDAYDAGFRKAFRVSQDQAGTANAAGAIDFSHYIEAQNLACSGWNYTSSSSKITLQFWFRASTNQTFYGVLYTPDGTVQSYPFSFTASGNNAWTKITHTISGNSNITINNDNGTGLILYLIPFYGTDYTDNSKSVNAWSAHSTNYCPDMASTWLTAGASTFDVTGIQLEVGSVATDFEHRSFGQELDLCRRYYYNPAFQGQATTQCLFNGSGYDSSTIYHVCVLPTPMRAIPTIEQNTSGSYFQSYGNGGSNSYSTLNIDSTASTSIVEIYNGGTHSRGGGVSHFTRLNSATTDGKFRLTAEL